MNYVTVALVGIVLMTGTFAKASEKWGTVYCSLLAGGFPAVASASEELTRKDSGKRLVISGNGYSCEASGIIFETKEGDQTCYEPGIAEPSMGLPSGAKVTLYNNRDFSSSLGSADGYSCECIVKLERSLKICQQAF